ncbi:MAG TPA: translocation/assembly module TamB domain-containing protein [Magnetospirillum sp.]|jgi:translocation and assembly module TamB|nr:translocation/assembly module TamB domain-containing protein [Magnetospirillum sp.]
MDRKWLRRLGLGLAALMAVAVLLVGGGMVVLHSQPGERWIAGKAEEAVPGLSLEGFRLGWPFRMRAERLRLADSHGIWLEVEGLEIVLHPLRLWRGLLDIDRLMARQVKVKRLPESGGGEGGTGGLPEAVVLDEVWAPIRLEAPVVGEPIELELSGTFQMRGHGGTVDLGVRSARGDFARIDGTAGTDFLDLRWYLKVPRLDAWQRIAGLPLAGELSGTGNVAGRLPSPEISGQFEIGQGQGGPLAWNGLVLSGSVIPQDDRWQMGLQAEIQAPRWGGQTLPDTTLAVAGDVAPDEGAVRLGHAQVMAGGTSVAGAALLRGWGRQAYARLHGRLDLADLGVGEGRVAVRAQLAGDLLHPVVDGLAQAEGDGIATGIAILDRALGSRPRVTAAAHWGGGQLMLTSAEVNGARASLWAAGRVDPQLGLWARLAVPDLSVIETSMSGSGTAFGHVGGPLASPSVSGVARLDEVQVGDTPSARGELVFDLAELSRPHGYLSADLAVADVAVTGSTRLEVAQAVSLHDLILRSGQSQLAGDLTFKDGVRGRLTSSIPELKAWEGLLGRPLAGRVEAEAVLDPANGQSLRLSLRGDGLTGFGATLPHLDGNAELTNLTKSPTGSATIAAPQAEVGGHRLDNIHLAFSGRMGDLAMEQAEATLGRDDNRLAALRLTAPARLTWQPGSVTLAPASFALGGGRLALSGRLAGQQVEGRAQLESVPLDIASLVLPTDAVGTVSGNVTASGRLPQPDVRFSLSGHDIGVAAAARAGLGHLAAQLDGSWSGGRVQAQGRLSEGQTLSAEAEAAFPLPGEGPLAGRFQVNGDIGRLAEAMPLAGHVFAGKIDAAGRVGGTLAAPALSGRATLADGRYENVDNGTLVTALNATLTLSDDRVSVQAEGGDGGKGRVTLQGEGGLDGGYRGDLSFQDFTALRRDEVEAAVTGALRLEGTGTEADISGKLTVPRAEVDIGRLKGAGPVSLDVVEINLPPGRQQPKTQSKANEAPVTMALDVAVMIEHAFVRGRGLDSEWQGDVGVGGTLSKPSLTGKLTVARGQFDFLGKQFKLTNDSTVTFQGGDTIDPALDVTADASATDITAQVQVTGTAKEPTLTITSQPPLPQDEVLARVLFGRSAGALSAFQQVQLAQLAASGFTGGGSGFDPIGKVRGFLGLDVLGVGSSETKSGSQQTASSAMGGPTLSAGKYVGPDTFVRVEQGTSGLGKVTVEQDIGGGFSLESSLGEQSGGGVGFNWRRDY